jgi:hypothetical protein
MHTVLCDVDGWNELDAIRQVAGKGDGGVRSRLCPFLIHHHIKVSAIHLINMVALQKGLFCGVKPEVCAPEVHGVTL